MSYYYS